MLKVLKWLRPGLRIKRWIIVILLGIFFAVAASFSLLFFFAGTESIDPRRGFLLGALLGYDFKLSGNRVLGFEFDPRWDVSDEIGGLFTLRSHYTAPFAGSWRFHGGVSGTYATEDYMDEYFSIHHQERRDRDRF